jgi:hypothetical protein
MSTHVVSMSANLVFESRTKCADSRALLARSRHTLASTRCLLRHRTLRGGSDAADRNGCQHPRGVVLGVSATRSEAESERTAFVRQFGGYYVSDIVIVSGGRWGWTLCPDCGQDARRYARESVH